MVDVDVTAISLVKRGANRVPLRVVKKEKSDSDTTEVEKVLNFKDVFGGGQKVQKDEGTALLAVVVEKGVDLEKAKELIEKAGLVTDCAQEQDDATLFVQKGDIAIDLEQDNQIVYKAGDQIACVVQVDKEFAPFSGSTDFTKNLQSQGFFPGLRLAADVFTDTVITTMFESADKGEAQSLVDKAVSEFGDHLNGMVDSLPDTVFKLEKLAAEFSLSFRASEGSPGSPGVNPSDDQSEFDSSDGVDTKGSTVASKDDGTESTDKAEDDESKDTAAKSEDNEVLKAIGELAKDLGGKIDAVEKNTKKALGDLTKRVETAEGVAKSADEAVSGTANVRTDGDRDSDDGDTGSSLPLLDTAFQSLDDDDDEKRSLN
jgi:hypothetical protein